MIKEQIIRLKDSVERFIELKKCINSWRRAASSTTRLGSEGVMESTGIVGRDVGMYVKELEPYTALGANGSSTKLTSSVFKLLEKIIRKQRDECLRRNYVSEGWHGFRGKK